MQFCESVPADTRCGTKDVAARGLGKVSHSGKACDPNDLSLRPAQTGNLEKIVIVINLLLTGSTILGPAR